MNVLNQVDPKRNYAGTVLNRLLQQTNEKQRATDLVFGTIRNRSAIDMVIAKLADCPTERIPRKLLNIIRIGTYELIYNPATAEHAILNEAVENAKTIAGKKQTGFVNAVLRQITRHLQNRQIPLSDANGQSTLPQTFSSGCEFDISFLPELETLPLDYFSSAFSLPKRLVADWLDEFGTEKTRQVCFASNRRPGIYIRPNTLKTTTQQLAEKLHQADIDLEIAADESMINIKAPAAVTELPGFAQGLFSVQDMTASQAVKALEPQSNWTILDLCAAPGVKTTQLAEVTGDKAEIIATDIDAERLEKVKENIARLGINSIATVAYAQLEQATSRAGPFDCVLLDVPCSNTGVLARRPEARFRIRPKAIAELVKIQGQLLETASSMIKPGGKICYSTCSIQNDENNGLIKKFLQEKNDFKLESELLTLPSAEGFDHDGGYVAVLAGK
ncbi:Ribosomal RNA small subunit methyltransferase B [subsurface metagenome]